MDRHRFEEVVQQQLRMSTTKLVEKGREYADDRDMLRNFKVSASLQGVTPRQALGGQLALHMVSVYDLINDVECAPTHVWDQKITHALNYLLLLRALSVEELEFEANSRKTEVTVHAS